VQATYQVTMSEAFGDFDIATETVFVESIVLGDDPSVRERCHVIVLMRRITFGNFNFLVRHIFVGNAAKKVTNAAQSRALLVV
jgi:hypothetical protein